MTVNHINGIKDDNRPENLELATHSEQITHMIRVLKKGRVLNQNGIMNTRAKLNLEAVAEIRTLQDIILMEATHRNGHNVTRLATKYGVNPGCIWDVIHGRTWRLE